MVASNDDTLIPDITSMLTGGPVIFREHHDNVNFSTVTSPPLEHLDSNMFQQSPENHNGGPEPVKNNLSSNTEDFIRAASPWDGSVNRPLTSFDSIDDHMTSTMVLPHTQETRSPPPATVSDTVQQDFLHDLSMYHTASQTMTIDLPPLTSACTDDHSSLFQKLPPESLANSQEPHPAVPDSSMVTNPTPGHPQVHISNAVSRPVQDNFNFRETATSSSAIHTQTSADAQGAFERLIPFLRTAHSGNFRRFVVAVLKETHDHVSLDDVFCILYSDDRLEGRDTPRREPPDSNYHFWRERLVGIKLLHLVRESFRMPETFQDGLFRNSMLPTVNFHEFLRNFVAMKILFGCMQKVEDSSQTLSRLSVYKMYYILCQNLIQAHPELAKCPSSPRPHFLGQPKIGVLTKLLYPDLVCKRLGRRGESKVHYIGWKWNESIVGKEILSLLELDVNKLREYPKRRTNSGKPSPLWRSPESQTGQDITYPQVTPISMVSPFKPLSSFVNVSCRAPDWECSPRIWQMTSNMVPKQSEWARVTMEKSVEVLRAEGVNLDPLITKINAGNFADDDSSIRRTAIESINVLWKASATKETYMHLYLAVILLLLPVIIASDQEVPKVSKAQIRASIKDCVDKLENEVATFESIDKVSLTFFSRSLRKMIHISEMTSCDVKRSNTKSVFKEMISDFQSMTNTFDDVRGLSACEDLFITGTIKAVNAFSLNMSEFSFGPSHTSNITNIINIGKSFQEVSLLAMRSIVSISSRIQEGAIEKNVPYQLFHLSAKIFHQITLSFPEISQLPIRIITFIILYFTNEMQQVSFAAFARRDPELSQETFRCWWIFSSMFQEYMGLISEVVALSQILV
ncbi:hypothetical protein JCM33374_g1972 [Metschnikowia sp. JCM 33374]|nr:hypothetical protein JCM33374_g1972 [Metschnikowia sp. JCM 33374]